MIVLQYDPRKHTEFVNSNYHYNENKLLSSRQQQQQQRAGAGLNDIREEAPRKNSGQSFVPDPNAPPFDPMHRSATGDQQQQQNHQHNNTGPMTNSGGSAPFPLRNGTQQPQQPHRFDRAGPNSVHSSNTSLHQDYNNMHNQQPMSRHNSDMPSWRQPPPEQLHQGRGMPPPQQQQPAGGLKGGLPPLRQQQQQKEPMVSECTYCRTLKKPHTVYATHVMRDSAGRVMCEELKQLVCGCCQATGENAHVAYFCPKRELGNTGVKSMHPNGLFNAKIILVGF